MTAPDKGLLAGGVVALAVLAAWAVASEPNGTVVLTQDHLATPAEAAVPACVGPDVDPWVAATAARVARFDGLFVFALEQFGEANGCAGTVTDEFDGARFGTVTWTFGGGATFSLTTMPPETSIVRLSRAGGFDDPAAASAALRAYADGIGVAIDWSVPEVALEGESEVRSFRDPESGLNASASLVFVADALVEVRFSMAL